MHLRTHARYVLNMVVLTALLRRSFVGFSRFLTAKMNKTISSHQMAFLFFKQLLYIIYIYTHQIYIVFQCYIVNKTSLSMLYTRNIPKTIPDVGSKTASACNWDLCAEMTSASSSISARSFRIASCKVPGPGE